MKIVTAATERVWLSHGKTISPIRFILRRSSPAVKSNIDRDGSLQCRRRYTCHHWCSAAADDQPIAQSPRDDDVLPDNLADALYQASEAVVAAINRGSQRCIAELLIPSFWDPISGPVFSDDGDMLRFWRLNRKFIDNLQEQLPNTSIKALFPDMGVTAMLQNQWTDAQFQIGCINSKLPVSESDDLVVLAAPDPQGVNDCLRIVEMLPDSSSVIMFNPRLVSGEVGIGLNVRRIRERFLGTFVTAYSLRPIGDIGTVFKKYPDLWRVFIEDETSKGRYKLVAESPEPPTDDALDSILQSANGGDEVQQGEESSSNLLDSVSMPIRSFQRFMKSLM